VEKQDNYTVETNLPEITAPMSLGDRKITSWKKLRDKISPQGTAVQSKLLVDRTFTIIRMRPYDSKYESDRATVYWIVALTDDGELFNCTLGGTAVCDVLDALVKLEEQLQEAMTNGDGPRVKDLQALGAGTLWQFTLRWRDSGAGQGYYFFD